MRLDINQLRSAVSSLTNPHITTWLFTTLTVEQWDGRKRAVNWEESFREIPKPTGVFEQILYHSTCGKIAVTFATWLGWHAVTLLLGLARNAYRDHEYSVTT